MSTYDGTSGNDQLIGGIGDDLLRGFGGDDFLKGNLGVDTLLGGTGDDVYEVEDPGDVVQELVGEGRDRVDSLIDYVLPANVEDLWLVGVADSSGTGNELVNALWGNAGRNQLTAGPGNDYLDGFTGADTMIGGTGDDTYWVDNAGDLVTESPGEGIDTVHLKSVDYALPANVENLVVDAGGGDCSVIGNGLDNEITGNEGNNALSGGGGKDTIDGGAGADTMAGGAGDDAYRVDDAGDLVQEAPGGGTDSVWSSLSSCTLPVDVEILHLGFLPSSTTPLDGTGNASNNEVYGNAGANHLAGAAGDDTLYGGGGDDTLTGGTGKDTFYFTMDTAGVPEITDLESGETIIACGALIQQSLVAAGDGSATTEGGMDVLFSGGVTTLYLGLDTVAGADYSIRLDGEYLPGDFHALGFTLVYDTNHAPVANAPLSNQSVVVGDALGYTVAPGTFSDPDAGDSITYNADLIDPDYGFLPLPSWLSFDPDTLAFSGTPGAGDVGTVYVMLTATDSHGAVNAEAFELDVWENAPSGAGPAHASVDVNGDDSCDLLWQNATDGMVAAWTMSGMSMSGSGVLTTLPDDWKVLDAHGDYDGDGKTDLLVRNATDGMLAVWQMNGAQIGASAIVATIAPNWVVLDGHGDYDGDGRSDLLWQNTDDGMVAVWRMNGTQIASTGVLTTLPGAWNVVDSEGDFNGDGRSDVLLRNCVDGSVAVWQMNGTQIASSALVSTLPSAWAIVDAHGDYDSDGRSDVLLRNGTDGTVSVWLMNGTQIGGSALLNAVPMNWTILDGHGDYNGDGKSDLLWRNSADGMLAVWQMDGTQMAGSAVLGTVPLAWKVLDGHGDYNADGKSDLLWRNGADGMLAVWQMNGTQMGASAVLGTVSSNWNVLDATETGASLKGDGEANTLWGTVSNDAIAGAGGNDTLTGNAGNDRFVFDTIPNAATNADTIQDFAPGADLIELSHAIFTALAAGDVAAGAFLAGAGVSGAADGNDYLNYDTSSGALYYDADGAGGAAPVLFATLVGAPAISAADFAIV